MKHRCTAGAAAHHVLVFRTGDDVLAGLTAFARAEAITAAQVAGIGAFARVTLGHFDPHARRYHEIAIEEQTEVVALAGNISRYEDGVRIHVHALVSLPDGTTRGGHLIAATVQPTLEVFVTALPTALVRHTDAESGLALIDLDAQV
jgi:predicted DNA-binding protein with PD1-like motif